MPETNDSMPPVSEATTAREKFEQERLSRRAALRKIGMTTGMALFGMFALDDLARISLSALRQHKETQAIAQTVAEELRGSGVAFADAGNPSHYNDSEACQHCCNQLHADDCFCLCLTDYADADKCLNNARYRYGACLDKHCGKKHCRTSVSLKTPCDPCGPVTTV